MTLQIHYIAFKANRPAMYISIAWEMKRISVTYWHISLHYSKNKHALDRRGL